MRRAKTEAASRRRTRVKKHTRKEKAALRLKKNTRDRPKRVAARVHLQPKPQSTEPVPVAG